MSNPPIQDSYNPYPFQNTPEQGYQQLPSDQYPPQGQYPPLDHYPPQDYLSQGYQAPRDLYTSPLPQQYPPQGDPQQSNAAYHMNHAYVGYPPPQPGYGAPIPSPYGMPAPAAFGGLQQQWGTPPSYPTPPSPGYGPNTVPSADKAAAADALHSALKDAGTNGAILISTLAHCPATDIPNLKATYKQKFARDLEADVDKETSNPLLVSHFRESLLAILRGPLQEDVYLLRKSIKGVGTNEQLLNDVVLSRSNADLNAIKAAYYTTYKRSAEIDVAEDLSGETKQFFNMIMAATRAEESAPVIQQAIDADVQHIHTALERFLGKDGLTVCSILSSRSDPQIRAIAYAYEYKFRVPLEKTLSAKFNGHMRIALVQILRAATDRAMRDAVLLEDCMKGIGTKDDILVARVVQMHWNRDHMGQVRGAYKVRYKKELAARLYGDTRGNYRNLLIAMVE